MLVENGRVLSRRAQVTLLSEVVWPFLVDFRLGFYVVVGEARRNLVGRLILDLGSSSLRSDRTFL